MDYRGNNRANENTENGVCKLKKEILKFRNCRKALYSIAHSVHTEHKRCKAEKDGSDILLFRGLREHGKHDTDERENGSEGHRLEKLHYYIIA